MPGTAFGKSPSTIVGILGDQLIDKSDIFFGEDPAAIHEHEIKQCFSERKGHFLYSTEIKN